MTEGQKGGEFFTTSSLVKLIVEVTELFHRRISDPGSGGMFVQTAEIVATIGVVAVNTATAAKNQGFITCLPHEELSVQPIYLLATGFDALRTCSRYRSNLQGNLPITLSEPTSSGGSAAPAKSVRLEDIPDLEFAPIAG